MTYILGLGIITVIVIIYVAISFVYDESFSGMLHFCRCSNPALQQIPVESGANGYVDHANDGSSGYDFQPQRPVIRLNFNFNFNLYGY